jgi:hypothetical protein
MSLSLRHTTSDYNFMVFSCYLLPENSKRGRDAQTFYAHLLGQIYLNSKCDALYVCEDFNSRLGSKSEILIDTDHLPKRTIIDKSLNQHGHELKDFLIESKMCTLNGRFSPNSDDYTSVSRKGRAVVDYICVPLDYFHTC